MLCDTVWPQFKGARRVEGAAQRAPLRLPVATAHSANDADRSVWIKGLGTDQGREAIKQHYGEAILSRTPAAIRAEVDVK